MLWLLFALLVLGAVFGNGCAKGILSLVLGMMLLIASCAIV